MPVLSAAASTPPPAGRTVAAIDVGSNATRLTLLRVDACGVEELREAHRYPMRLGSDVFAHGEVGEPLAAQLVDTFVAIASLLDERQVTTYRAVATSAMREARNAPELARRIFADSGIELEIISGAQEGRLAQTALVRAVGSLHADTLIFDQGGGSLEVSRPRGGRGRSLPLGTLRLLAMMPALRGPLSPPELAWAQGEVARWVRRHLGRVPPTTLAVGAGGTLEVLARLLGTPGARAPRLACAALGPFVQALAGMQPEERAALHALPPDRADLILPTALILAALTDAYGLAELVVPGAGLRDAILHGLLQPATPGEAPRRLLGGGHEHTALARRSARLAVELFDDLAALHQLWPSALEPLLAAVYAWYFGAHLEPATAERHAIYLLSQVEPLELPAGARRAAIFALQTLPPGAAGQPPAWPPALPAWLPELSAPDGGQAPPDAPAAAAAVGAAAADDEAERAAWAIAGVLRLALILAPLARRATALHVDVLADPVRIEADLSVPLNPATLAPLERALGRRIEVR